jgi:Asp-tRNA(Asn)/Glu-tRNA(Gln) amidotransferase A subunit family amidase
LDEAGAVLVAKLSLGALAMGDRWYGGPTRNPWNPEQGSSGSSAGSASATAAGLVAFSLGSETLGSIVSPSRRCGTTGLRPTFGRVSRHGCMALSWSMDKIGPITRSVEDAALVFGAILGADGQDPTAVDAPFVWPGASAPQAIRVGYVPGEHDEAVARLRALGFQLVPVELPSGYPVWDLVIILTAEAATAFHEVTRDKVTEGLNTWPDEFRRGHFIPAVDYLRAQRIRTELMQEMDTLFDRVDVLVGGGRDELGISNLTGHPCVVLPSGGETKEGVYVPGALTFTGRCFGETTLLQVAQAFQRSGGDHLKRPPGFS